MTQLTPIPDTAAVAAAPEALEHGRYAVFAAGDGSWVLARAAPICDRCRSCGCGEQADPLTIPPLLVSLIGMDPDKRAKLKPLAVMRQLMGGGSGQ